MLIAEGAPLRTEELNKIDAYWRAANYLSVGQIYLMGNPLLREPLLPEHVKPRLLGHWGTTPGLNLVYAHLNRVIAARRQEMIYVTGPGHGGPGLVANVWLEGTYAEVYPRVSQDVTGMSRLFTQFSFPGGVPSHVAPETPGSIHEGGELGYSLSHAYGAVLDNPDLVAVCVIGDGEAETGPLATSWHSNKFLDPAGDGAVLPILHLNGYKIANPAVLARIGDDELDALLRGYGHEPYLVEGDDPAAVHQSLAATLDAVFDRIAAIQRAAREDGVTDRPQWPVIVLRTPRAGPGPRRWTGCPSRGRGGPTRYPCRQRATTRRTWPRCASGCCPTARTSSSTSPGRRDSPLWTGCPGATCGWAPTRMPTAAATRASWSCPTSASTASRPGRPPRPPACWAAGCATCSGPTCGTATSAWSVRTRPSPTGSAPCWRRPTRCGRPGSTRSTSTSGRTAG